MTIHIENLTLKCILGILDFERVKKQEVTLNLELDYLYDKEYINYADICETCETLMKKKKFLLLENALLHLSKKLKKKFPLINRLSIKISKPTIIKNALVSVSETYHF